MPHLIQRTALMLLAGAALTACASSPTYPVQPRVVRLPPPAVPPQALAAVETAPEVPSATAPVEVAKLDLPAAAPVVESPPVAEAAEAAATGEDEDAFARARSRRGPAATYTVRKGDTLAEIAGRLGTEIDDLARLNGLKKPYRLQPGQVLKNPKAPRAAAAKSTKAPAASSGGGTYTVRRGDTLFSIAQRNGTTVEALRSANGMGRNSSLIPGRKLKLPGGAEPEETAEAPDEDAALAERMANARRDQVEPAPLPRSSGGERIVTDRQVTGRVVSIDIPGKAYKVKKGDNLERVAGRLDSDIAELARINKLKKPYRLQPGQTIRGPGTSAKAYVVGRGDTLGEIARRFSVTEAELRSANGLRRGASVAPGRRLRLPAGYRDRGPITTTTTRPIEPVPVSPQPQVQPSYETPRPLPTAPPPRQGPSEENLPERPQPYRPTIPPRQTAPIPGTTPYPRQSGPVAGAPVASPPVSDAQISEMGRGLFVWPIQGQVISGFGGRGQGPRNDGLNIRANTGDAVRAAASGDVVYAGDQVPGFGNLVLIKHADGWVTAYGHLGRVEVRMQQKVAQGQQIGQAGSSGGVAEPQLHFEVRYAPTPQERARPVDPALVLPR